MRTHKPWFRATHGWWYVEIAGKQVKLAKGRANEQAAYDAFYKLMAGGGAAKVADPATVHVATVCDLFLDFSQKHHQLHTYRGYKDFLQDFCDSYGTLLAQDVKPLHVTRWLDGHPGWKGGRRNAVIAIKRTFNWAASEGILTINPVRNVKKPPRTYRDRILKPEEKKEILDTIKDRQFREFVFAMQESGARPSEVRRVAAANVDLKLGVWIFWDHKTLQKTGKPRIVFLSPALQELTRKLVETYPEGPLFRGPRSKRASPATASVAASGGFGRSCRTWPGSSATPTGTALRPTPWSTASASPRSPNCSAIPAPIRSAGTISTSPARLTTCTKWCAKLPKADVFQFHRQCCAGGGQTLHAAMYSASDSSEMRTHPRFPGLPCRVALSTPFLHRS